MFVKKSDLGSQKSNISFETSRTKYGTTVFDRQIYLSFIIAFGEREGAFPIYLWVFDELPFSKEYLNFILPHVRIPPVKGSTE